MTKLRRAGSPVEPRVKMTRGRQDAFLLVAVMSCRAVLRREGATLAEVRHQNISSFRAALRLDDPVLDDLIAQGAHKRPWTK